MQSRDLGVLDGTYQAAAAVSLKQLAANLDSSNPFIPALSNCMDDVLPALQSLDTGIWEYSSAAAVKALNTATAFGPTRPCLLYQHQARAAEDCPQTCNWAFAKSSCEHEPAVKLRAGDHLKAVQR